MKGGEKEDTEEGTRRGEEGTRTEEESSGPGETEEDTEGGETAGEVIGYEDVI